MISLNYRDARPIYEQVRDGLRHLVVTGAIAEGEKLPSVRAMAASLAINPNTIQRAFAARGESGDNPRRESLLQQFEASARELMFLGMTARELAERVERAATQREGEGA